MKPDEITRTYVTPSIEEAAALHALGCPILTSKALPASDLAGYIRAGYFVREGSVGFVCSIEREDFAEILQAYRDKLVRVPVAAYQDGVAICRRHLKEQDRNGR
jgi:hypothetical protein